MMNSIILVLAMTLIAAPALAYKQEDLEKLKATNSCESCDLTGADLVGVKLRDANLTGADLRGAKLPKVKLRASNLTGANLTGAVLINAKIDFADFSNAKLCNTVMPDGQRIFKDC